MSALDLECSSMKMKSGSGNADIISRPGMAAVRAEALQHASVQEAILRRMKGKIK